jgi:hypothetical protein
VATLQVAHDIPGRLRLRLRAAVEGERLAAAMREHPGVTGCTWAARTGSLLLQYRPEVTSGAQLRDAVAARTGLTPAEPNGGSAIPAPNGGPRQLAGAITRGMTDLDAEVTRVTGGALDLRTLLPLALGAWALAEIFRGRAGRMAWSTALWYAHGLFRDYSLPGGER